jgi:hypothetical protein
MMDKTSDTTDDALREHIRGLRRLGISGRAAMTFELSDNLRQIVKDGVRHRHPDWDEAQVKQETLRIVLGDDLYNKAFGNRGPAHE